METPEIDKLINTLEYQVNQSKFTTQRNVDLLAELKKLKGVEKCSVLDDVIVCECVIPKPKDPFCNVDSKICRDCEGEIN